MTTYKHELLRRFCSTGAPEYAVTSLVENLGEEGCRQFMAAADASIFNEATPSVDQITDVVVRSFGGKLFIQDPNGDFVGLTVAGKRLGGFVYELHQLGVSLDEATAGFAAFAHPDAIGVFSQLHDAFRRAEREAGEA